MNETNKNKKVIDTNKKLMLIIVDPQGNMDVNYFKDDGSRHVKMFREYINNKSIDNFLQLDLKRADKEKQSMENNEYNLIKIFTKNGYMLFMDMTNYRNHYNGRPHTGIVNLPIDIDHLSEIHKQILKGLSNEIIVDPTLSLPKTDKLLFFDLPVAYYDKGTKEMHRTGLEFDEMFLEQKEDAKHM